jgi:hypothetical protein
VDNELPPRITTFVLGIAPALLILSLIIWARSPVLAKRSLGRPDRPVTPASRFGLSAQSAPYGVTPTSQWVNFASQNTTVLGSPIPVGAVVRVFDPDSVQCGEIAVSHEGWYGLLPCYADDPTTPGDEGAQVNDPLHFTVNGTPAVPQGPDQPVWTANGALLFVDLAVPAATPTPTPLGTMPAPTRTPPVRVFLPSIQKQ